MDSIPLTLFDSFDWNQQGIYISIALKNVEQVPNQRHIGILHRKEGKAPFMLHLEFHHRLKNNEFEKISHKNYFIYVPPYLDEEKARAIAGLCRRIHGRSPAIPYGIISDHTKFSDNGLLRLGEKSHGLTCATFVLAVFLSNGMELLNEDQWPHRKEDEEWHAQIVNFLITHQKEYNITNEHIENIRNEENCVRFRPEEVAASFSSKTIPANFEYARDVGLLFVQKLS